jgi:hypothetical protein
MWKEGKLVSGKWIYPNGTSYEGGFENNKPKGLGKHLKLINRKMAFQEWKYS